MPAKMNHYDAALRVCVDSLEAGSIRGRVVSRRLTAPITFGDLGDLLLQVEEVLNRQNFPQAFERTRSFVKNPDEPLPVAADLDSGMTKEEVEACRGEAATFSLYVITRRSTTWQGFVEWPDGTRQEYVSVLELIKLLDHQLFSHPV